MWAEVLPGPSVKKKQNWKAILISDNCGLHNVLSLREIFSSTNVECDNSAPNMTDRLQVMDFVVNAPLKSVTKGVVHSYSCK